MILLVEDNDDDAALILRILRRQLPDTEILVAGDGSEALELIGKQGERELQLVLLDVHLPRISGLQVLEELRKSPLTRRVPVVMLSGSKHHSDVLRSYDLGANSFLLKAEQAEQLEATIQEIVPYWLHLNHTLSAPGSLYR